MQTEKNTQLVVKQHATATADCQIAIDIVTSKIMHPKSIRNKDSPALKPNITTSISNYREWLRFPEK